MKSAATPRIPSQPSEGAEAERRPDETQAGLPPDGSQARRSGSGGAKAGRRPDALALAYRYIIKRERSVAEVRVRLERAECPAGEIMAAIDELVELGYLDDSRYVQLFIADKRALEQWGTGRIVQGLRAHGIAEELISAGLAQSESELDADAEVEQAVGLLSRRFPHGVAADEEYRKAFGMLARKGYSSEICGQALRRWRAPR